MEQIVENSAVGTETAVVGMETAAVVVDMETAAVVDMETAAVDVDMETAAVVVGSEAAVDTTGMVIETGQKYCQGLQQGNCLMVDPKFETEALSLVF